MFIRYKDHFRLRTRIICIRVIRRIFFIKLTRVFYVFDDQLKQTRDGCGDESPISLKSLTVEVQIQRGMLAYPLRQKAGRVASSKFNYHSSFFTLALRKIDEIPNGVLF